jgi:hypothetical protein
MELKILLMTLLIGAIEAMATLGGRMQRGEPREPVTR